MNRTDHFQQRLEFDKQLTQLRTLSGRLAAIHKWTPALSLKNSVESIIHRMELLEKRLEEKPVITIIGPSGSGKSTLANALCGSESLTEIGVDRPTTREIKVITRQPGNSKCLFNDLEMSDVEELTFPATLLKDALLIDTPDTDSSEKARHLQLLNRVIEHTDVLLCVFDARNPKAADHIRAISEWADSFPDASIGIVLNHCDRIVEDELKNQVLPDFKSHLNHALGGKYERFYSVSARSELKKPDWSEGEEPLHAVNDLEELRKYLQSISGGAVIADCRLEQARHLRQIAFELVSDTITLYFPDFECFEQRIEALETEVYESTINALADNSESTAEAIGALLCGALDQRWSGPVGMLVTAWRRAAGLSWKKLTDQLNPIQFASNFGQGLARLVAPTHHEKKQSKALMNPAISHRFYKTRMLLEKKWPDLAEELIDSGFTPDIRSVSTAFDFEPFNNITQEIWLEAVVEATEQKAEELSGTYRQWIYNAPALLVSLVSLAYLIRGFAIPFLSSSSFFSADLIIHAFLPGNFYLHSIHLFLLMTLLPFWCLQKNAQKSRSKILSSAADITRKQILGEQAGLSRHEISVCTELHSLQNIKNTYSQML